MWLHSLSSRQTAKPLMVPLTGQTASGHSVTYDPSVGRLEEDIDFYRYRYRTRRPRGPQPIDPIRCTVSDLYGNPPRTEAHHPTCGHALRARLCVSSRITHVQSRWWRENRRETVAVTCSMQMVHATPGVQLC